MEESYFVLYCSEAGDHYLRLMDKAALEHALDNQYWGPNVKINTLESPYTLSLEHCVGLFIWKGQSVIPQHKTTWSI